MSREGQSMRQSMGGACSPAHPRKTRHSGENWLEKAVTKRKLRGFPGGLVVKNLPANAGDMGSNSR